MTSLPETELLRARWRRALERHALDIVDRADFGVGGLSTRLRTSTVQLLLLPSDPEAEALQIDDGFWAWLEAHKDVEIEGWAVRLGDRKYPTAQAAALTKDYGDREPWNSYLAVHRSGAIEFGLGDRGGWERQNREGETVRVFNLVSIVACTWALLSFSASLNERVSLVGPWQLTIALRGTKDALLGNVGEGWAEPGSFENRVGGCVEENLLWHTYIDDAPTEDAQQRLAFTVGDRIEDAWGVTQRRYLARVGDHAGRLDLRRIAE
jgi:hypothetical protein